MRDDWTDRLSDYLDGGTSGAEHAEIEARLKADPSLRDLLAELRAVKTAAADLPDRPPAADLWPAIENRIRPTGALAEARATRRRFSFTVPQLAAASVALLFFGSGALWLGLQVGESGRPEPVAEAPAQPGASLVASDQGTVSSYEEAIRELEIGLAAGRELLDSATVRTLEESLATIDRAIAQAESALRVDPANAYLNRHLADAMTTKLALLRHASVLAGT